MNENTANKEVEDFIVALGSIVEISKKLYDDYISVGFTPRQSLELTKSIVINIINHERGE